LKAFMYMVLARLGRFRTLLGSSLIFAYGI